MSVHQSTRRPRNTRSAPQLPARFTFARPVVLYPTIRHHASVAVLALGGVLGCAAGAALAAPVLPQGTVPIKWSGGTWSTDPSATLVNTTTNTGVNQLINQQAGAAVYNWDSFKIANGSSVYFNMALGGNGRALNRVMGNSDPMVIQGQLGSNGQVYLMNQNGILFGAGAQVNVAGLVASALNIDTNDFLSGLQSITSTNPTFFYDSTGAVPASGLANAKVIVENGASLSSPGGRVFLFGGQVSNAGRISAPDGQVALAGGSEIYLALPTVANLRGLLIDVTRSGAAVPTRETSSATNETSGVIETARGNTTLTGYFVNQMGRISATTSATANGSIYLQARDSVNARQLDPNASGNLPGGSLVKVAGRGGELVLGSGSVTEIRPDNNGETTDNTKLFYAPSVDLSGRLIQMKSGASIVATGGNVTAAALSTFDPVNQTTGTEAGKGTQNWSDLVLNDSQVAQDNARFVMESGASIDVSGARGVPITMERNIVTTSLLGANDLKDAPLQRDSVLYRQKITFDIRNPVPILGDTSSYLNAIQRGAAEKLSEGGTIKVVSSGDVALAKGAVLNISGGSLDYQGGYVNTTKLVSNGKIYDISVAPKDLRYDYIYGTYTVYAPKFGTEGTQVWTIPTRGVYQPGYVEGKKGGSITLLSRSISSEATIEAGAVAGPYQRDLASKPSGGTLTIGYEIDKNATTATAGDYVGPSVRIAAAGSGLSDAFWANPAAAPRGAVGNELVLGAGMLNDSGLSALKFSTNGRFTQEAGANLNLPAGGSLSVLAGNATIAGDVRAAGGAVSVTATKTASQADPGDVLVSGRIDTSGTWVNDSVLFNGNKALTSTLSINGGTINLQGNNVGIADTALLDVSGGARLGNDGKLTLGNGGRIALAAAGTKIDANGKVSQVYDNWLNGKLTLDGRMLGAAAGKGGSLALAMLPSVRIGGTPQTGEVAFDVDFFNRGGFADYTLASISGMTVSAGTRIAPRAQNLLLDGDYRQKTTGSDLRDFSTLETLADNQRGPVNLSLQAVDDNAKLRMESGSSITTDPLAKVSLLAGRQLIVDGRISAPAGTINLTLNPASRQASSPALDRAIWLRAGSELSTAGTFVQTLADGGLNKGDVLDGGSINIDITRTGGGLATGLFVAEKGSVMDVSGGSAIVDLAAAGQPAQPALVGSKGGAINIKTVDGGIVDATLRAGGGTATATGGQFNASITGATAAASDADYALHNPTMAQSIVLAPDNAAPLQLPAGAQPGTINRSAYGGRLALNADRLNEGGFGDISLRAEKKIETAGSLSINAGRSLLLNAPSLEAFAGSTFAANAPYVKIANVGDDGVSTSNNLAPAATGGTGQMNVNARLIDLQGEVSLNGIGNTTLNSSGDIRMQGVWTGNTNYAGAFNTGGDLLLRSAQAYPTTGLAGKADPADPKKWAFNLNAVGGRTISFESNGAEPDVPLSAGGNLLVTAGNISQAGVLRAPFGRITLDAANQLTLAAGSVTSVSAGDKLIPYGGTLNGRDWIFTSSGGSPLSTADGSLVVPSKAITLKGDKITLQDNSTTDVSGSQSNLYGYEFVPGVGGSKDVLDTSGAFAIVPSLGNTYAPYDPQYYASFNGVPGGFKVGSTLTLSAGSGLLPGTYTLLPARYALLPGAFLVKPAAGYKDMQTGVSIPQVDGSAIVSGYAGTLNIGLREDRSSGWLVAPSATVRRQAEYRDSYGNEFFAGLAASSGTAAPRGGRDAGILAFDAVTALNLNNGTLKLAGAGEIRDGDGNLVAPAGRGAAVDIASSTITVTNGLTDGNYGGVVLHADTLNNLGIESLLLGGLRGPNGTLTARAAEVTIDNAGQALVGKDIILASREKITVKQGSAILADSLPAADTLNTSGAGALLRVAGSDAAGVVRSGATPGSASLTVQADAVLGARDPGGTATLILDSTKNNAIDPAAVLRASTVSIAAGGISAGSGAQAAGAPGLVLGDRLLGQVGSARDLTLKSYSSIDFYGTANLGLSTLDRLTLDAYAITGRGAGTTASINARQITLANSSGASALSSAPQPLGNGSLTIATSENLVLGNGAKTIQGFDSVTLAAGKELSLSNNGKLGTATLAVSGAAPGSAASLTISSARISGTSGADQAVSTTGHLELQNNAATGTLGAATGLGAKVVLSGKDVRAAGTIDLPSGSLSLAATGTGSTDNVLIASGANLRATGAGATFDGVDMFTSAGRIDLSSAGGSVRIGTGTTIDVSGAAGGGDAGTFSATARNGAVQITNSAGLKGSAAAGYRSGSAFIEAKTLGRIDNTNIALNRGGFAEERSFRAHTGGIMVGPAANAGVNARNVSLEADGEGGTGGNISINNNVGGAYAQAGEIRLASAAGVMVSGNGQLVARSTGAGNAGGSVYVSTTSTGTGNLNLGGRGVDVRAGAGGDGGTLWLRAPQADSNGTVMGAVAPITGPVTGASSVVLEGVKTYSYTGNVSITNAASSTSTTLAMGTGASPQANTILGDAKAFMTSAGTADVAGRIGRGVLPVDVRAGTEVKATGDITVANALNFFPASAATPRPEQRGGALTLRAGGNLNVRATISDGFAGTAANSALQVGDSAGLATAPTWSYRLVGGADLAAADTRRVNNAGTGDVLIGQANTDVIVRTATGNIEIAAGHNVQLLNPQAVVYTTGAGTTLDPATQTFNPISNATARGPTINPFTDGGGYIRIEAGNDVLGTPDGNQMVSNWLFRRQNSNADNPQTAWWARYDLFRQNIATFGGGGVTVRAGRDISDLSVSAATNARLPADVATGKQGSLVVQGGGDLNITAGRNIAGGTYYEGRGIATLQAGGALTNGARTAGGNTYKPILALQDGVFNISANGDAGISGIFDPTLAPTSQLNISGTTVGAFSSYTERAGVNISSLRGDVVVARDDLAAIAKLRTPTGSTGALTTPGAQLNVPVPNVYYVAPGSLNAVAFAGDVSATVSSMMPAPRGALNLLAAGDVTAQVTMMDRPATGTDSLATATNPTGVKPYTVNDDRGYATTHQGDTSPVRMIARDGDLTATGFLPKAARLIAGRDIRNLALTIQNLSGDDQTVISAGRDYIGQDGSVSGNIYRLNIDGPGQALVKAGRNVDLGVAQGIVTRGNTANRFLDEHGASLTVLAGVSGAPDYAAVAARYLPGYGAYAAAYLRLGANTVGTYLSEIAVFVRDQTNDKTLDQWVTLQRFLAMPADVQTRLLDRLGQQDRFLPTLGAFRQLLTDYASAPDVVAAAAVSQIGALPATRQEPFLQRVLFAELGRSAAQAAVAKTQAQRDIAYQIGYDAIGAVFPGSAYRGDLLMYSSQIKTQDGGDISLFVPGGMINAGLVVPSGLDSKAASDLGVLTVAGGDISAISRGDFQVNQSRVFTLAGGGILMWSSEGSLDAGRGAKTATSAPAPIPRLGAGGTLVVDYSGAVSGSGIKTVITDKRIAPGDIILAAPKGSINAGDAGIEGAGNLTVVTPILLGADNIQVAGASSGATVQTSQSAPPPPPVMGDESRKAVDQVSKGVEQMATARPPVTSNTFIGFGE